MPLLTVPNHDADLLEFNKCHNPAGPGGGQFCSDAGAQHTIYNERNYAPAFKAVLGSADPGMVASRMIDGVPHTFKIYVFTTSQYTEAGEHAVTLDMSSTDGKMGLKRRFTRNPQGELVVWHNEAWINGPLQGAGAFKQVMRSHLAEYQHLGVRKVEMLANLDVGGYAWARYGFLPADPKGLAASLISRTTQGLARTPAYKHIEMAPPIRARVNELIGELQTGDGTALWRIAGLREGTRNLGLELLRGMQWHARLDLQNADQIARFTSYVGGKA